MAVKKKKKHYGSRSIRGYKSQLTYAINQAMRAPKTEMNKVMIDYKTATSIVEILAQSERFEAILEGRDDA